jgi:hypothetical protein
MHLATAERDLADGLLVLESARRSAAPSDFPRPDEAYRALPAINAVGRLYFESVQGGSSMGSGWEGQLRARGLTQYSPSESDTVKNDYKNYGRYREFIVDVKKRKIYQHVDLGGGDSKACLQIYFEPDRTMGRVLIAEGICQFQATEPSPERTVCPKISRT